MNIIVCMKYIGSMRSNIKSRLPFSPSDCNALGMGTDLKIRNKNSKLIVLSMSPPEAKDSMQDLYSYGVDYIYLVSDKAYAESDTLATTLVISMAIKKIMESVKIDLILCGNKTIDSNTGQISAGLAVRLGAQYCNSIQSISLANNEYEIATDEYKIKLNEGIVVADVNSEWEMPFPSLQNIRNAREKKIVCWSNEHLGIDLQKVGFQGSPTKIIKVQKVQALVSCDIIQEDMVKAKSYLKQIINTRGGDVIHG